MKRLAFAMGLLALSFIVSSPARADYAVVRFGDGSCQIWWDSAANPWGAGWTKIAVGLPDHGRTGGPRHRNRAKDLPLSPEQGLC